MPRIRLSQHVVDRLKAPHPSGRQTMYWDRSTPGFGVRVSGTTTDIGYIVQGDLPLPGKKKLTRRVTVAKANLKSFDEARKLAGEILDDIRNGIDPKAARLGRGADTLEAMVDLYISRHPLSEKSKRGYRHNIHRHLGDWLKFAIATIDGTMIERRYHELIEEKGAATAGQCLRIFRAVYNYAAKRDAKMPANPTRMLDRQWVKVPRRRTLVGADRLGAFYAAVMKLPNPIQRDYILFVLFTGLRRTAAASLRWSQVDFTERTIRIPAKRTEHKLDEFKLPMSDFVHDLLLNVTTRSEKGFVFVANSRSGHVAEPKYPLGIVAEETGIAVSIHDLRRDFITAAENTDMSAFALKALVDHALPGDADVTAGYMKMTVARLREPAEKVAALLKQWCRI
jgi:integrase